MNRWRLLVAFIKQNLIPMLTASLAVIIFVVVFTLYHLPLEPVGYAALLTMLLLLAAGFVRFRHFSRTHHHLISLHDRMTIPELPLPEATNLIERDYQQLIRLLDKERLVIGYNKDRQYQDMVEYYTIWAHQIKTPIAAMRLLLQSDSPLDKNELSEQLFRIEQYAEMVLQFIRLDNKGTDFVFQSIALDECVKQAVRKYAKWFIRKQIKLNYDPLGVDVLTDEKWLVFVIEQLLSNALKYTHQGEISIYMHPDRPRSLVIEDTGIGIAPSDLPRVFEHSYTGFNGRADKKSTGIGLYLCKRILDKLSHRIEIESAVGRGTRIILGLEAAPLDVE